MSDNETSPKRISTQIWHFLLHLRWHYQVFILSGGFLLGGLLSPSINWTCFLLQFANVHLLLFGGATAYNSYWDKDEGPIGGLKNPPEMQPWMWFTSILLQLGGLLIALPAGSLYAGIYALSMLLFWLYSTPLARWKGNPVKSLIAIGVSTGTNSLLLGYLSAGVRTISLSTLSAAVGVALVILSLYPTSQLYQRDEDKRRGDETFAIVFGFQGVFRFFEWAFFGGVALLVLAMAAWHFWVSIGFLLVSLTIGYWVRNQLTKISAREEDYQRIMRIKFGTSLAFVGFIVITLLIKHTGLGIVSGLHVLLQ